MLTGNIIQTGQVIVMCLGIHTHTHTPIKEKEARDSKEECMVGIEERKRKGDMIYYNFKTGSDYKKYFFLFQTDTLRMYTFVQCSVMF